MSTNIVYSDIEYNLTKTQYSDFEFLTNNEAIKSAIETILSTKKGDRVRYQNPYFGSNIYRLLFEKMTIFSVLQIEEEIFTALGCWEPRIKVTEVKVSPDYENSVYKININYTIVDIGIEDAIILYFDVYK